MYRDFVYAILLVFILSKNLNLMKKTLHSSISTCWSGLLVCFLLLAGYARLFAQCNPDIVAPVITCPANQSVLTSPGQCSQIVALEAPVAVDNCGAVSVQNTLPVGNEFPTGTTVVLYTATDLAGNMATCQTTVKVSGSIPRPVCDRWVTVPVDPSGTTTIYPEDILEYGPYTCTQTGLSLEYDFTNPPLPSLSFTGTGTHEVYGAVITEDGFWEKCWSFVSIVGAGAESCTPDVTPPQVQCRPYYIVYADNAQCQAVINLESPVVTDNCGLFTLFSDAPPGNLFSQGPDRIVTYTATDIAGNSSTCTSTIRFSYQEIILPVCHPLTVDLNSSGTAIVTPNDVLAEGPYSCTTPGISLEININAEQLPFLTLTQPGTYFAQVYITNYIGIIHGCQSVITVNPLPGGCNPETTPPLAHCTASLTVETNTQGPGLARMYAADLNDASTDNCTAPQDLHLRVTTEDGTVPPTAAYADVSGIVQNLPVFLWVGDQSGNWSRCSVPVTTTPAQCTPDTMPPLVTAPPNLTFTYTAFAALNIDFDNLPDEFPEIYAAFGTATHWDNCDDGNSDLQESFVIYPDKIIRRFFATDAANNLNDNQFQTITILDGFTAHLPGWTTPGMTPADLELQGVNVVSSVSDEIFVNPCNTAPVKILRTWVIGDFEFNPPQGLPVVLPPLDTNNDGITGDPYDIIVFGDSVWLYENHVPVRPLARRAWSYQYEQTIRVTYGISGTVFIDTSTDCAFENGEPVLKNWKVKAIGQPSNTPYTGQTDSQGHYSIQTCLGDTAVEISLDAPYNYSGICPPTYVLDLTQGGPWVRDIPVQLTDECNLLNVDIASNSMSPCFAGYYAVNYFNFSQNTISGTHVDVALDPYVQFQGATLTGVPQGNNTYRFQTGALSPGASGSFKIFYVLDCDAPDGATHCTEASISPYAECPAQEAWSGAELRVTGACDGDSVRLKITNVGVNPMAGKLNYVVTEDLIMARQDNYILGQGEYVEAAFPADGTTWRMETPQEPGHPWGGLVSATVEGCGGINTTNLVNVFTVDDNDPFTATDCTQNTSAFDPNDKQGFPTGYGNEHFIRPNTDLEYKIRFQNTGTDTAFTVVILDTLSQFLQAASIRPGAASHAYDFDLLEGNILRFRFDHILLPDSNVNEVASHGFVQFRIAQQPDNPLGTVIPNAAAIYFDFNEPVITNETWHTLGEDFLEVSAIEDPNHVGPLLVYPNPASENIFFEMPTAQQGRRFELSDATGRIVCSHDFPEKVFRLERVLLPAGVYFFRIYTENGAAVSGKIVVK